MFEKIRLPKDVIWRWCVFLSLACLLSYLVGQIFDQEVIYIDTETRWCLEGTYKDTKAIPQNIGTKFITFKNNEVLVFTECK